MRWVEDNNIRIGSKVEIIRSGDVIPKILECGIDLCNENAKDYTITQYFSKCPVCGAITEWNKNKVELICPNIKCKGRLISQLVDVFSVFEFEDFGEPTIKKLYEAGYDSLLKILSIEKRGFNENRRVWKYKFG